MQLSDIYKDDDYIEFIEEFLEIINEDNNNI